MKWRNHAIMAASVAAMLSLSVAEIAYCTFFANMPDQMEKIGKIRLLPHRGITHELALWMVPLIVAFLTHTTIGISSVLSLNNGWARGLGSGMELSVWVLFLPGVVHLLGDMLTPRGIQVAGRKVSMGLFKTGDFMEYVVAGVFAGILLFFRR